MLKRINKPKRINKINKTYTRKYDKCKTPDIDINQLSISLDKIDDKKIDHLPKICLIGNDINLSLCNRDVSNDSSAVMSELGIQNGPKDTKICKLCINKLLELNVPVRQ